MARTRSTTATAAPGKAGIHNRVAVLRVDRGWSRQDLADRVGINYQTVGYIERGDYAPSLELALRMAHVFGVAVESLFSLEPFGVLTDEALAPASTTAKRGTRRSS